MQKNDSSKFVHLLVNSVEDSNIGLLDILFFEPGASKINYLYQITHWPCRITVP
jgi:hypothetical protein